MTASKFCLVFSIVLNSTCYAFSAPADSVQKPEKGIELYGGVNRYINIGNINMPAPIAVVTGTNWSGIPIAGVQAKVLYGWQAGADYWINIPGHNEVDLGIQMAVAGLEEDWYYQNNDLYSNVYYHKNYINATETFNHYVQCCKNLRIYFGAGIGEGITNYQTEKMQPVQNGDTYYDYDNTVIPTAMLFANIKVRYQITDKVSIAMLSKPVVLAHEFASSNSTSAIFVTSSDLSLGADIAL